MLTPYQPTPDQPWNLKRVVHLHRRAGFAANWAEIRRDLAEGPEAAVTRLLTGGADAEFERMSAAIGDAAVGSENPARLKAWWIYRMLFSPDPLGERLALMWHNHFATSQEKVKNLAAMREQNEIFRQLARAPFGDLLPRVIKQPAMLAWLDADTNRKGHPNENLARELMELFTLGEGHYTEHDVREAARALTGWTVKRGKFHVVSEAHDSGLKTILGGREIADGDDLLKLLLEHPTAADRLAWRLCRTFLAEEVASQEQIDKLATQLRDSQLDIGNAVETILRSRLFFSEQNIGRRIMGPVEYVVSTVRGLEMFEPSPSTLLLAERTAGMGQDLFYPPNVFGWDEGKAWINSRTLIARSNFIHALCRGKCHLPQLAFDPRTLGETSSDSVTETKLSEIVRGVFFGEPPNADDSTNNTKPLSREQAIGILSELLSSPKAQLG